MICVSPQDTLLREARQQSCASPPFVRRIERAERNCEPAPMVIEPSEQDTSVTYS